MISLIMAIHNEEEYLPRSLSALKKIEDRIGEFIFILDRCSDSSEVIVRSFFPNARIIKKEERKWKNSYSENLQIGFLESNGEIILLLDADIVIPSNLLNVLLPELKGNIATVGPKIVTDKNVSFLNLLYHYWEKISYSISPLGREARGACRLIRRDCLEKVGGFKDVIAPDTQLDLDLRKLGYKSKLVEDIECLHIRRISLRKAVKSQIMSGIMRRQLKMPLWRVIGHALLRLRPLVIYGYLKQALHEARLSRKYSE